MNYVTQGMYPGDSHQGFHQFRLIGFSDPYESGDVSLRKGSGTVTLHKQFRQWERGTVPLIPGESVGHPDQTSQQLFHTGA